MEDNNRPHGLYGDVYDRSTQAKTRFVTKPYQPFTRWEDEAVIAIVMEELNKTLNLK